MKYNFDLILPARAIGCSLNAPYQISKNHAKGTINMPSASGFQVSLIRNVNYHEVMIMISWNEEKTSNPWHKRFGCVLQNRDSNSLFVHAFNQNVHVQLCQLRHWVSRRTECCPTLKLALSPHSPWKNFWECTTLLVSFILFVLISVLISTQLSGPFHLPYLALCINHAVCKPRNIVLLVFGRPGGAAFAFAFPEIGTRRSCENDLLKNWKARWYSSKKNYSWFMIYDWFLLFIFLKQRNN